MTLRHPVLFSQTLCTISSQQSAVLSQKSPLFSQKIPIQKSHISSQKNRIPSQKSNTFCGAQQRAVGGIGGRVLINPRKPYILSKAPNTFFKEPYIAENDRQLKRAIYSLKRAMYSLKRALYSIAQ